MTTREAMDKVKVLFLAANPAGTSPLALDEEIRAIDAKIRGAAHRDRLDLVSHWAVRLDDLSGLLMRQRPHVVHFSGHGAPTGEIVLLAADGSPKPVPPEALAGLFRVLKDNVRVVVLNACYSEAQAEAIVREIDCAVGMSRAIQDDAAIAFAAEFYQAMGYGKSVQDAFDLGVVRLIGEGVADAKGLVKLHRRKGIKPSEIILIGDQPDSGTKPQEEPMSAKDRSASTLATVPRRPGETPRQTLLRKLRGLAPADWASLVAEIPGGAMHVGRHNTVPEQVAELVQWAESTNGPGLKAIEDALAGF